MTVGRACDKTHDPFFFSMVIQGVDPVRPISRI
jgi:hypothetical protein